LCSRIWQRARHDSKCKVLAVASPRGKPSVKIAARSANRRNRVATASNFRFMLAALRAPSRGVEGLRGENIKARFQPVFTGENALFTGAVNRVN
jgi:hypothetical protein